MSFFPNSWNLLLLGWKFSSSRFYLLFFLIFGSLWYSSFVHECLLYTFWFLTAWLGARDPVVLLSYCDLIWAVLCAPGIPGLWHSLGFQLGSPYWASFGLLTLADWAFLLLYGILKPFPFMGLWTPILWTFSSFSFFLSSLHDSPMCYFSLGRGLWLILNLNTLSLLSRFNNSVIISSIWWNSLRAQSSCNQGQSNKDQSSMKIQL